MGAAFTFPAFTVGVGGIYGGPNNDPAAGLPVPVLASDVTLFIDTAGKLYGQRGTAFMRESANSFGYECVVPVYNAITGALSELVYTWAGDVFTFVIDGLTMTTAGVNPSTFTDAPLAGDDTGTLNGTFEFPAEMVAFKALHVDPYTRQTMWRESGVDTSADYTWDGQHVFITNEARPLMLKPDVGGFQKHFVIRALGTDNNAFTIETDGNIRSWLGTHGHQSLHFTGGSVSVPNRLFGYGPTSSYPYLVAPYVGGGQTASLGYPLMTYGPNNGGFVIGNMNPVTEAELAEFPKLRHDVRDHALQLLGGGSYSAANDYDHVMRGRGFQSVGAGDIAGGGFHVVRDVADGSWDVPFSVHYSADGLPDNTNRGFYIYSNQTDFQIGRAPGSVVMKTLGSSLQLPGFDLWIGDNSSKPRLYGTASGDGGYPLQYANNLRAGLIFTQTAQTDPANVDGAMLRLGQVDDNLYLLKPSATLAEAETPAAYGPTFSAGALHFEGAKALLSGVAPIEYPTNERVVSIKKDDGAAECFFVTERDGAGLNMGGSRYLYLYRDEVVQVGVGNEVGYPQMTSADSLPMGIRGRATGTNFPNSVAAFTDDDADDPALTAVFTVGTGPAAPLLNAEYFRVHGSTTGPTWCWFAGGINAASLPTSNAGLAEGDLWNNAGVVNVAPAAVAGGEIVVDVHDGNNDVTVNNGGRQMTLDATGQTAHATINIDFGSDEGGRYGAFILELPDPAHDITWLCAQGPVRWAGTQPDWPDHSGKTFVVFWRFNGRRLYMFPSEMD